MRVNSRFIPESTRVMLMLTTSCRCHSVTSASSEQSRTCDGLREQTTVRSTTTRPQPRTSCLEISLPPLPYSRLTLLRHPHQQRQSHCIQPPKRPSHHTQPSTQGFMIPPILKSGNPILFISLHHNSTNHNFLHSQSFNFILLLLNILHFFRLLLCKFPFERFGSCEGGGHTIPLS